MSNKTYKYLESRSNECRSVHGNPIYDCLILFLNNLEVSGYKWLMIFRASVVRVCFASCSINHFAGFVFCLLWLINPKKAVNQCWIHEWVSLVTSQLSTALGYADITIIIVIQYAKIQWIWLRWCFNLCCFYTFITVSIVVTYISVSSQHVIS